MSSSNSKLLPNCESTSCIQNKIGKRSFLITSDSDMTDYHNNELVKTSVIKDKCFSVDNIRNKPETANKKRKPSRQIYKKKLQSGFGHTTDEYVQTNSDGDEFIIVTDSFIRQQNNEFQITKTDSQADNASISKSTTKEYPINLKPCDENDVNFNKNKISEYVLSNSEDDEFIIVTDPFIRQQNNEFQIAKTESQDLFSKCNCQHFFSLKNVGNKLFNTKIKHFAFNNDAKKVRQSILHQKYLEANILEMLITKEPKKIIQSIDHIPIFNLISINNKFEEYINLKENDHIEPNTLSILKDVEYVTDYCNYNTSENQFSEQQTNNKNIKFNNQAFKVKPIEKQHVLKSPTKSDYVQTLTEDDEIIIDTKTSTRQLDIEFQIRKTESQGQTTGEYVQTNSEDDEFIIVTDPFIRQQNNEF